MVLCFHTLQDSPDNFELRVAEDDGQPDLDLPRMSLIGLADGEAHSFFLLLPKSIFPT